MICKAARWSLVPVFDMNSWATHQKSMNGKREGLMLADFRVCAEDEVKKRISAETIAEEFLATESEWLDYQQLDCLPQGRKVDNART